MVLPGTLAFRAGPLQLDFTLSAQDQLDYEAALDGQVSGRGTNRLVLLPPQ